MERLGRCARPLALDRSLCVPCRQRLSTNTLRRGAARAGLQNGDRTQRRFKGYIARPGEQAYPIHGFYAELLKKPVVATPNATRTAPSPPPTESPPQSVKEDTLAKARNVFGSKLEEQAERKRGIEAASREVAGVVVPPKPEEPDNCCMSGCVNCVWDMYRDEMEEWAAKSTEARANMQKQREGDTGHKDAPTHVATSMDEEGGGSETSRTPSASQDALFDDIPVGIREFMRTEKKLKEKHKTERAPA